MRIVVLLALVLAGCGTSSKDLECPFGEGMACASMSKVMTHLDHEDAKTARTRREPLQVYMVHADSHESLDWL